MTGFSRDSNGVACLGGLPLPLLLAQSEISTPAYVYDLDGIATGAESLIAGFASAPHLIAYAVKANSAGSIVRTLARAGCGADVVSRGELELARKCDVPPSRIVMSGVAKTDDEIDFAIAEGIYALQVENPEEVARVAARARALGRKARISLRLNPGVAIDSHSHIATGHDEAKFGIPADSVGDVFPQIDAASHLELVGLSTHVGSMLSRTEPYLESARVVCDAARRRIDGGHRLEYVDFGGGFGIDYGASPVSEPAAFAAAARGLLGERGLSHLRLVVEPGRALVGPFGAIVASVIQSKKTKGRHWVFIDAAMNDLLRPALYGARHRIEPVERPPSAPERRVAGPVCESADDFGEHALGPELPERVIIRDTGAYGFTMASEYNGRPLPAEVFVSGGRVVHVSPSPGREAWLRARLGA